MVSTTGVVKLLDVTHTLLQPQVWMHDEYNPKMKLNLSIRQDPDIYADNGVDFAAIKKIKGITLVVQRHHNSSREELFVHCRWFPQIFACHSTAEGYGS